MGCRSLTLWRCHSQRWVTTFLFLDLAKLLASNGLAVSFVTTPANVSLLHEHLHAVSDDLDIRLVALPTPAVEGLDGRERMDLLPLESRGLIFQMAQKLQHPFHTWMDHQFHQQTSTPPVCIIYDIFMGWAIDTAQTFNVASFLFNTCGAFAITLMHSISCSILQNALEKDGEGSLVVSCNMPSPLRLSKHEHLKSLIAKPVWAIGPVHPQYFSSGEGNVNMRGKMVDIDEEELVRWLDSKSPRSVVYISFGSQTVLSEEQTHALARGLEGSGQPFVWAIKMYPKMEPASSDSKADLSRTYLPEGFVERTKERGLIIRGWASQLLILSHSSVGAFISHCGWNSALESISLGVPILTWPMLGDQHLNGIPEEERVKEAVTMALTGDKGEDMRERAEKLKEMATIAMQEKVSSAADLTAFVRDTYKLNSRQTDREAETNIE